MPSMDRVAYKPLGTSAPEPCDSESIDGSHYEEHEAECELEARPLSLQSYHHQYKKYYRQGILYSSIFGYFGPRQLRILLYLVAILLFLVFIAQLSTNERNGSDSNLSKSLPATASAILLHHDVNTGLNNSLNLDLLSALSTSSSSSSSSSSFSWSQEVRPGQPTDIGGRKNESYRQVDSNNNSNDDSHVHNTTHNYQFSPDSRPQYDSYLSSVINERDSSKQLSSEESFDDIHFLINEDHLRKNLIARLTMNSLSPFSVNASEANWWEVNMRDREKYVTVTNYIRAMKSFSYNASITLTTQATTEFMYHTLELCKRWDGPISVAVFTPGPDLLIATTLIKFMRQCLPVPLSACIRDKVTWHLVYNKQHGPALNAINFPKFHLDSTNYPLFVEQDQCPKFAGPEPSDSIKQFEEDLKRNNKLVPTNYRQEHQIPYPINVLRNTARLAANTKYVLASDIELYPSINLVPSFINLIANHDLVKEYGNSFRKFVFTLPIFEVKSNVPVPKTKEELVKLAAQGDAIFFHKWVCDACQNFPNRLNWLQTDKFGLEDYQALSNELVVFEVTQRNKTRDSWEPIFIGTNEDPLYDDRLTWDGRRDKMAQMYEMCLQDYQLLVLGNAFLVHAPGIKHIDKNDNLKRLKYMRENNAIYDETMSKMRQQYSAGSNINKC